MAVSPPPLRRNRDFVVLWSGQVVSTLGSQATYVVFPLLVLALTHSPAKAGLVGFVNTVPVLLFYLPAGVVVDRFDRKRVMLACSAAGAVALGSLPFAAAVAHVTFAQIVVVAFIEGTQAIVFTLAEQSALPHVVAPEQVADAIAQNQARTYGATIAGPPLGGFLFSLGRFVPFVADAVSYAVSFGSLLLIRTSFQAARSRAGRRLHVEIAEGLRWLWRQPFLRTSALLVAGGNCVWQALVLVLIVRAREQGASSTEVGVMLGLAGAGGLLGAVAAPRIARRFSPRSIVAGAFWIAVLPLALLAAAPDPYVLGVLAGAAAFVAPPWNAVVVARRLTIVPDRLRGRVNSVARMISGGAIPLGSLAAGLLIEGVGTVHTLLLLAAAELGIAVAASTSSSLRALTSRQNELLLRGT